MIDTLFFGSAILSCIALCLLGFSILTWKSSIDNQDFRKHGRSTTAIVLQKFGTRCEHDPGREEGEDQRYVAYEYRTPGGETVRQKELLTRTDWEHVRPGQRIEVLYLPHDPTRSLYRPAESSVLTRSAKIIRTAAYCAGGLTIGCYVLWYVLAVSAATEPDSTPKDQPAPQVEVYRITPSREIIDGVGLGRSGENSWQHGFQLTTNGRPYRQSKLHAPPTGS